MAGGSVCIRALLVVVAIGAVGLSMSTPALAAGPAAVSCGSVVSTDAYLAADLSCPTGNGVTLAGNLTLDLRGHQFGGPGTTGTAISVRSGFSVMIQNGGIRSNVLAGNGIGFGASASSGNSLSNNAFVGNNTGIHFSGAGGTVTRNTFTANGIGFTSEGAADPLSATLERNILTRNGSGIFVDDQGIGLRSNIATRNTDWGIYAPHSIDLGGNRASGNGNSPQCVGVVC
jgi:parallel beta-helix repeat protein